MHTPLTPHYIAERTLESLAMDVSDVQWLPLAPSVGLHQHSALASRQTLLQIVALLLVPRKSVLRCCKKTQRP